MLILKGESLMHTPSYSKQLHSSFALQRCIYSEGRSNRAAALWKYPGSSFVTVKYILKKKTTNEITWKMAWVHPARESCMFLLSALFLLQFSREWHRDRKRYFSM